MKKLFQYYPGSSEKVNKKFLVRITFVWIHYRFWYISSLNLLRIHTLAVKGNILQSVLKRTTKIGTKKEIKSPIQLQTRALKRLLRRAKDTEFGKRYRFHKILSSDDPVATYQRFVPIFDYDQMYESWWKKTIAGGEDISWPGIVNKFALSSGTSGSASKQIPVSRSQLRKIRRASLKQIQYLNNFGFEKEFYDTYILGIGGSTSLTKIDKRRDWRIDFPNQN